IKLVNDKKSPIHDREIIDYLKTKKLNLQATNDWEEAYRSSEIIIIATPTDYDEDTNYFNTSSVESVIKDILSVNMNALIVIKSTIPVGFINNVREKYKTNNIIFS
ncbi:UDP-glucose 6-dehydrogenase, partial [Bacillus sp. D-CC]